MDFTRDEEQNKSTRPSIIVGTILVLGLIGCAAVAWQQHREKMPRTSSNAIESHAKKTDNKPILQQSQNPGWMPRKEVPKSDAEGNLPTCPFGWKSLSPKSAEAVEYAHCGMRGLPKAQHMVYKFGHVFMSAKQTVGSTTYVRMSAIIYRQKIVVPQPGKVYPVAVHMEVAKMNGQCGLKNVVGMFDGAPLNQSSIHGIPPYGHHSHLQPANPSAWEKVPSPKHILVEAKSAAEFAAKKMSHCPFASMQQPEYQVLAGGFRFQMTVMVKNPSGKMVPCMAEVHASVHSDYTLVKGHCFPGQGC